MTSRRRLRVRALLVLGPACALACAASGAGGGAGGGAGRGAGASGLGNVAAGSGGKLGVAGAPRAHAGSLGSSGDSGAGGDSATGSVEGGAAGDIANGGTPGAGGLDAGMPSAGQGSLVNAGLPDASEPDAAPNSGLNSGGAGSGGAGSGGAGSGGAGSGGAGLGGAGLGGAGLGGAGLGGAASGGGGSGGTPAAVIPSVLTRSYDVQRSNANIAEVTLNVSNVNPGQFGKLFDLPVDDEVYAQILYVPQLNLGGAVHNVIYVATMNNTLYAFDADAPGTPLWQHNFNGAGAPTSHTTVGQACGTYRDYTGNIGIVSTPVIDGATRTMYFATRTVEGPTTLPELHAVDIATGAERANSPVLLSASVLNQAQVAVPFDPVVQNQRMSLALVDGAIYLGFSSFCDSAAYHGWLLAYDAATLTQLGAFNDTPDGAQAGIWQAGAAATVDPQGHLYVMTGNGSYDGITNFGESVLKLSPKTLGVLDFFTPANYAMLNDYDRDLGSAGTTWLADANLLVGGGKEGKLYLIDPANMGHSVAADTQILQSFQAVDPTARPSATHHIHNGPSTWVGPTGTILYLQGENDYLRAFHFNHDARKFDLPSVATGTVLPPLGMPGGMLTTSANGAHTGSGIVWATTPRLGDANQAVVPGVLRAYDAETLALLWESTRPADEVLDFAKFNNPTVVNGKVYVGSFSRVISVYGPRATPPLNLALNKVTKGSAPCANNEGPANAVNGSVILGDGDEWCSLAANPFLQVDLGSSLLIQRVVLRHANAGGDPFSENTRNFTVQTSSNGTDFTTVADVAGNQASITTHDFAARSARYVRLNVTVPTQTGDMAARIYELEVYAP